MKVARGWFGILVTAALLVGYTAAVYCSFTGNSAAYYSGADTPIIKGLTLGILLLAIISLIATKSETKG